MNEVRIQDWPSSDLNSTVGNSWMPAYGFQQPGTLMLEKEDFVGNPDAEYFLHGTTGQYMYLETIQEETSDDLRSESSDLDSRNSPLGWLATDSEGGSVICINLIDDVDSDREIACPPKRRKQEIFLAEDEDEISLSRSSSLLQFETLEKQCQQETHSQFSFDSLEVAASHRFNSEYDGEVFRNFQDEINRSKKSASRDSLLYNASTSSDSSDSDTTVENSRSCDNLLKTWRSFDSLLLSPNNTAPSRKFSSENLSEDSGYGDQLLLHNYVKGGNTVFNTLSGSTGQLEGGKRMAKSAGEKCDKRNSYVGFGAYDCDVFQNFNGNFGVSYHDLTNVDQFYEPLSKSSPLTDMFLRKKRHLLNANSTTTATVNPIINIDTENKLSKISAVNVVSHAASVPNLLQQQERFSVDIQDSSVNVYSVPKDLNFIGDFNRHPSVTSVAEKNWNLADLSLNLNDTSEEDCSRFKPELETTREESEFEDDILILPETMAYYKREGSYSEAMSNRVDLSDDENSLRNKHKLKLPKTAIVDFDKRVLKAISEQSLQSLISSTLSLHGSQKYLNQKPIFETSTPTKRYQNKSTATSTPNLNRIELELERRSQKNTYFDDDRRKSTQEINSSKYDTAKIEEERNKNILLDNSTDECEVEFRRKGSIIKSSTSTSGMSDIDDRTLRNSVKSFSGSNGSKGVHFSPVVAEVNWRDDASTSTVTPDRESLYSLRSSSPERHSPVLLKPTPQYANSRRSVSHPDLSDTDSNGYKKEFLESLKSLRHAGDMSKSQPDVSKLKRKGSQLIKTDREGHTVKVVNLDGVQYQHTHLDLNRERVSQRSLIESNKHEQSSGAVRNSSGSKNSLTSKFPFYGNNNNNTANDEDQPSKVKQSNSSSSGAGKRSSVVAMAENTTTGQEAARVKRKNKSGLGGFLQRLASFRLGAKKGQEQKDKLKRKEIQKTTNAVPPNKSTNPNLTPTTTGQKPDYIYIPLKVPAAAAATDNNNAAPVSAKPPLPKQPPPRVVHASVKKAHAQNGSAVDERRRRRTIDSTCGVVESGGSRDAVVGRHGNVSMDGPMGLIETDLDTEVTVITNGANAKARSLLDLGCEPRLQVPHRHQNADGSQNRSGRPHKSMEFLLDKQNLKVVEPPENELQKTERVMSEHELRVQRSLQKLTVPEWYKNSQIPSQGFLLKKNRETRWTGTGSKTTSLSSLGSGTQSPLVLSPTPAAQPFVRWSTSKLNSTASSPCQSTRSSFNQGRQPNGSISPSSARSSFSYRQPYLGWRSQERLNKPRTPAERLASTLLSKPSVQQQEIQTSIKEVTSAIVHYVSGLKPTTDGYDQENSSRRSSSVSPRGSQKLCWLESSFVGTKPLDSPETPVTCSESPVPPPSLRLDLQNHSSNGKSLVA